MFKVNTEIKKLVTKIILVSVDGFSFTTAHGVNSFIAHLVRLCEDLKLGVWVL